MNKARRSLVKAFSWESFSFFLTLLIVFAMTGNFMFTLELSVACQVIKTFFLYLHERAWDKVKWGRNGD